MTERPKFLFIKKFRDFQHYHTRGAPWIKLYAALLSDPEFLALAEAAQAQLMKLWLLASQFGHPLPNKPKLLAGKIGTTGRFHLQAMIDAGFLIPCNESASTDASVSDSATASKPASTNGAEPLQPASASPRASARVPERREERVQSSEIEPSSSTARDAFSGAVPDFTSPAHRETLERIVATVPSPATWVAEMRARVEGMHGPPLSIQQLGDALTDYVGNGNLKSPSFRHFRAYLDSAAQPREPRTPGLNGAARAGGSAAEKPDWQLTDAERWDRAAARLEAEEKAANAARAAGVGHG